MSKGSLEPPLSLDLFALMVQVTLCCKSKGIYKDGRHLIRVYMLQAMYDYCDPHMPCPIDMRCLMCAWRDHFLEPYRRRSRALPGCTDLDVLKRGTERFQKCFTQLYLYIEHYGGVAEKQWWYSDAHQKKKDFDRHYYSGVQGVRPVSAFMKK